MKRTALLAALLLLQIGCAATYDQKELNRPVCQRLVNAKLVTVEVIRVNGCKTIDRSLEKAIEGFSKYVAGEVRTVEGEPVELKVDKDGFLTRKQLNPIIANRHYRSPSDITILLISGLSDYERRGHCELLPAEGGHVIVIQTKRVAKGTPLLLPSEIWWHLVIKHELLHALDVPSDRSHAWSGRHCTNPRCILYPRPDARAIMTGILCLGPPMDLCGVCRREIRQAQEAGGGKLVDPKEPYDHLKWLDELVELNPDAWRAYLTRACEYSIRKDYDKAIDDYTKTIELKGIDVAHAYHCRGAAHYEKARYDKAIADFTKAIELTDSNAQMYNNRALTYVRLENYDKAITDLTKTIESDPKNAVRYRIRGVIFGLAGQLEHSISDYERCLELKGDDALALNNLAWLLATCHKDEIRDGLRAVELARRACELAKWKTPEFLGTLAAAYAESGQFDKAVEYQNKAILLAHEKDAEEYRQHLNLYRSKKPCRDFGDSVNSQGDLE